MKPGGEFQFLYRQCGVSRHGARYYRRACYRGAVLDCLVRIPRVFDGYSVGTPSSSSYCGLYIHLTSHGSTTTYLQRFSQRDSPLRDYKNLVSIFPVICPYMSPGYLILQVSRVHTRITVLRSPQCRRDFDRIGPNSTYPMNGAVAMQMQSGHSPVLIRIRASDQRRRS